MSDPFSAATGAIGVISLAIQLVEKIQQFSSKVQNARKEVDDLQYSLVGFKPVLEELLDVLSEPNDPNASAPAHMSMVETLTLQCLNKFVQIKNDLLYFEKNVHDGKVTSALQKVRWVSKGEDIKRLVHQLEDTKSTLNLALQIATRGSVINFQELVRAAEKNRLQQAEKLTQTIYTAQRQNEEFARQSQTEIVTTLQEHTSTQVVSMGENISQKVVGDVQHEFQHALELFMGKLRENNFQALRAIERDGTPGVARSITEFRGRIGTRKRVKIRSWRSAFGTLILTTSTITSSYYGPAGTMQRKEKNISFMYLLPSFLMFSRGFCATFMPSSVSINLPAWREVPNDHRAFQLCTDGNLRELQRMIEMREVTVWDFEAPRYSSGHYSSPGRGTLLHVACQEGHLDIAEFLVSQGADPNMAMRVRVSLMPRSCSAGLGAIRMNISALELSNPLYMPAFARSWDVSCPNNYSFAALAVKIFHDNPSATQQQVQFKLNEFIEFTSDDDLGYAEAFRSIAGSMLDFGERVTYFKELIVLGIQNDPTFSIESYGHLLYGAKKEAIDWESNSPTSADAQILDLVLRFLRQKYPCGDPTRIPSEGCFLSVFTRASSSAFSTFLDFCLENRSNCFRIKELFNRGSITHHWRMADSHRMHLRLLHLLRVYPGLTTYDEAGYNALHYIFWELFDWGSFTDITNAFVDTLVSAGVDPLAPTPTGLLPLDIAAVSNLYSVVSLLRRSCYTAAQLHHARHLALLALRCFLKNTMQSYSRDGSPCELGRVDLARALNIDLEKIAKRCGDDVEQSGNPYGDIYLGNIKICWPYFGLELKCIERVLQLALDNSDKQSPGYLLSDRQDELFQEIIQSTNKGTHCEMSQEDYPRHTHTRHLMERFLESLGGGVPDVVTEPSPEPAAVWREMFAKHYMTLIIIISVSINVAVLAYFVLPSTTLYEFKDRFGRI